MQPASVIVSASNVLPDWFGCPTGVRFDYAASVTELSRQPRQPDTQREQWIETSCERGPHTKISGH